MQRSLIRFMLIVLAGGVIACAISGCAKNDSTYTSAPPTPPNANPVTRVTKKSLIGQVGINKMGKPGDQAKSTVNR